MTRLSHDDDDEKLVTFLSQYRPVPPPASSQLEEKLIKQIEQEPITSKYSSHWFWIVPSAISAILLTGWVSYRGLSPSPQIAANQDLETFLIDNWVSLTGDTSSTSGTNTSNLYWLSFADSQLETHSSYSITY